MIDRIVDTIFFGGGTPSILSCDEIESLMKCVKDSFNISDDAEITMECNPGTIDRKKLEAI